MVKAVNIITGIFGYKGDGKTTMQTYLLKKSSIVNDKRKLFCNYKLSFNFNWLDANELIFNKEEFNNSIIGIDELHEYADSRNSSSFQNKRICSFFLQSRHTNSHVYYTSQFEDQVDKRIIRITDVFIYCKNLYIDIDKDGDDDLFRIDILDLRYNTVNSKIMYLAPIFKMFDSTERINPFILTKEKEKEYKQRLSLLNQKKD